MKFHWFHLMPYPDLPEDFREKYSSVWVDVPSELFDPVRGHEVYNEYLDELEYAADMGFDGICVNEHHQNAYGLMPSPNLMAASREDPRARGQPARRPPDGPAAIRQHVERADDEEHAALCREGLACR